jgi:hypothetical protein
MLDASCLTSHPVSRIRRRRQSQECTRASKSVMAQERSCPCKDPLLRFPEEIPLHRYICQANKGSPPDAVCQGQELRKDNLLLRPLSVRRWEEVKLLSSRLAVYRWVELVRLD